MKNSPLKSKRPLMAKASLKAKRALPKNSIKSRLAKQVRKRLPLEKKSASQLVPEADKHFSKYIRLRDSELVNGEWVGTCITCSRKMVVYAGGRWAKGPQNGHMIGRGVHQLRYDEKNCNLQCAHCNAWLDKDEMITRYRVNIDKKYGTGTYHRLKDASRQENAHRMLTKPELLGIICDSKLQIESYLGGINAEKV